MKVWISKYALTQGIYEAEVEQSISTPSMVAQKQVNTYHLPRRRSGVALDGSRGKSQSE